MYSKTMRFALLLLLSVAVRADVYDDTNTTNTTNTTTTTPAPDAPNTTTTPAPTNTTTTPAPDTPNSTAPVPESTTPGSTTPPSKTEELVKVGAGILAATWIPFTIVAVLAFVVSFSYVRYYQHKRNRECGSTTIAIFAIALSLMTLALLPVDIYLVSSQQLQSNGQYNLAGNGWNQPTHDAITSLVQDAYWAMYALLMLFAFVLIPLAYFFYEEKDEEAGTTTCQRILGALKYTIAFIVFMAILLCIGAFATNGNVAPCNVSFSEDFAKCSGAFAEQSLVASQGANAIGFTLGTLCVIGFLCFSTYTATGMVTLPIKLIRSRGKSTKDDKENARAELETTKEQRESIHSKYKNRTRKTMSSRDRNQLLKMKDREQTVERALKRVDDDESGVFTKISACCRPFGFLFGILFFLLSLFLAISLVMTTADKLIKLTTSTTLDWKRGYSHASASAFYPVDKGLTLAVSVFPVDYIVVTMITYYFVICTMSGVKSLGIRFCHKLLFKIRPRRTVPQGILFFAFILMFSMIAMNVVMMTIAPQYVKFGNQMYPKNATNGTSFVISPLSLDTCTEQMCMQACVDAVPTMTTLKVDDKGYVAFGYYLDHDLNTWSEYCNSDAGLEMIRELLPDVNGTITCFETVEPCLKTRMSALLQSFFFNFWFFGAIYYWFNWVFILFFFFSLIYYTCKNRKNIVQAMINDVQEDFDDSDDDMAPFKWSTDYSKA
eukprot:m.56140 g.56140  ORF g.56140 m.56140 type:complete len:720 (-) comp22193_c0_seq2:223-2382(-)